MNLYITTISDTGGFIATTEKPQVSRLGLRRTPGQRYQIASILRHVTDDLKAPDLIAAVQDLMDDLHSQIVKDGYALIDWATPTEDKVGFPDKTGEWVEINRKWANWDMEKLDAILEKYMQPEVTGADNQQGNNNNGNQGAVNAGGRAAGNRWSR